MRIQRDDKIILFPKWKKELEKESLVALKEKKYDEALIKLDELINYHVDNHEIITGKLICLMELGEFNEAQNLCEDLLKLEDEHYYHYVHIYLTILFQTNQYNLLMDQVVYEFQKKDIPSLQREQFKQLYEISEKMNIDMNLEKEAILFEDLFKAVEENNFDEQWRQVEKLKSLNANPSNQIIELLVDDHVHPLAKTAIIEWLKGMEWMNEVEVSKFNVTLNVIPEELEWVKESEPIRATKVLLREIEQDNPSLYHLITKLLYDYTYVMYPIKPPKDDYIYIAEALELIGKEFLGITSNQTREYTEKLDEYIDKIKFSESLYQSIIDG
ncbi:M48 family metallopeptidase [Oceanobacillus sp. Castelsardo]|uniref:tetratricopeptide repeat protein n=1 Tax=Oceanobacillus sp. Castelsardo TaxID=1851204 RepID=UPI0008398274|nr:tetratricopeptide repeat protein [Oceanobacillus sp. Castelsardo]